MARTFKHLSLEQRITLKSMLDNKHPVQEIADTLGFHRSAIYREIERGTASGVYNPYYSEDSYRQKLSNMGADAILFTDTKLAGYIAELILQEHMSPERIIDVLQTQSDKFSSVPKTHNTIYRAIDNGLIPGVTRENLKNDRTTVFNNGQIHLAQWIREKLDIHDGDTLLFEVTEDNKIVFSKGGTQ